MIVTNSLPRTNCAGVARYGIQALRAAAELATERGHHRVRDVDVDDSWRSSPRRPGYHCRRRSSPV